VSSRVKVFAVASFAFAPEPAKVQEVHPERAAQIKEINEAQTTWKAAAHPRFATQPPGASKRLLGAKGNWGVEVREARQGAEGLGGRELGGANVASGLVGHEEDALGLTNQ